MGMIQLQRRLFFGNISFTCFATKLSSSSSLPLRPIMAKYGVLQIIPGRQLSCAPFGNGAKDRKCYQLKLKKQRVSCITTKNNLQVGEYLHVNKSISDGSKCGFTINSHLRLGLFSSFPQVSIFNYGFFENSIKLRSPNYLSFTKRFLSQVPRATDKPENLGVRSGQSGDKFFPTKRFSKYWKGSKRLAAHSKKGASNPSISASKDVDTVTSSEHSGADKKKDAKPELSASTSAASSNKQVSKVKGKKKQQPRIKKTKEQLSGAIGSENTPVAKGLKSALPAGMSSSTKISKSLPQASENNSKANKAAEVPFTSSSTKGQSNKKIGDSSIKEKNIKETIVSPQKQKPKEMGKLKTQGQRTLKQLFPPTGKSIVVVESATKAKVIQGYLGDMYEVLPSYGHVRDLAARSGSVRPDDDFSMVWEVPSAAWTHLKSIKVALNGAKNLILASDPDREGEAIAWHIIEMLQQQDALREDVTLSRVVFHEITEASIKKALQAPREIDGNLVHAYLARRALDYLIGFSISPLLWRKLPGCQSAGRVQSAALSLICDREMEIDEFKPQEFWTVDVEFCKKEPNSLAHVRSFSSHLTHSSSKKLNQFSISSSTEAKDIEQKIRSETFVVVNSKRSKMKKNPPSPYITSTLQQDAANKLQFTPTYTMKLAQKLYEGVQLSDGKAAGLITYTRTDGLHISDEAMKDVRSLVIERYGMDFASENPRKYFKKVKNAQEAHEAIRPTDIRRLPSMLIGMLDEDSLRLYTLIWSRTVACQMEPATIDQIQLDIGNTCSSIVLRSACSRVEFHGYRAALEDIEAAKIMHKEHEGNDRDETFEILRSLKLGDSLYMGEVDLKQHHTQPPPRYSEGSLVKKLEELGIGRPSTYASTLKVLKDRNYVTLKSRVLHPEFRGRMVSEFLSHHFTEVTDYSFTADMETELDNVSAGLTEWKGLLRDYWTRFSAYCTRVESVHIHQVEKMLEKRFGDFLFASLPDQSRTCPSCMVGTLIFKVSRFGAGYFIGCDQHPKCKYIAKMLYGDDEEEIAPPGNNSVEEPKVLGVNPDSNEKILLKKGPFGFYLQLGEDRKGYTPKRASLSLIKDVESVTLEDALEMLRYPITLGDHPTEGGSVILQLAKTGYTIRHKRTFAPVPKNLKPKDITMEKAAELLLGKDVRRCGRPKNKPKLEGVRAT